MQEGMEGISRYMLYDNLPLRLILISGAISMEHYIR